MVKLVLDRKFRVHGAAARFSLLQHVSEPVIVLRPHDKVDRRVAAADFRPFRLRDTASDRDPHGLPRGGALLLELAQPA